MAKLTNSQSFRITDSYLNLIVGVIVVVAIAVFVVGLIRGRGPQKPTEEAREETAVSEEAMSLPTKHTVAAGEDLWKISEKYYKTGYNWVDIANENNLANPNRIETEMELTIPNVTPRASEREQVAQAQTLTPTPADQKMTGPEGSSSQQSAEGAITGNSYTVVKGDFLWSIALRAYGDGYKWVQIARTNKLVNPDVIHPGNMLTLPR